MEAFCHLAVRSLRTARPTHTCKFVFSSSVKMLTLGEPALAIKSLSLLFVYLCLLVFLLKIVSVVLVDDKACRLKFTRWESGLLPAPEPSISSPASRSYHYCQGCRIFSQNYALCTEKYKYIHQ